MQQGNTGRRHTRRRSAAGRPGWRSTKGQDNPGKIRAQEPPHRPAGIQDEWYGEVDWGAAGGFDKDAARARRRIELLREERMLQQVLRDTFDC